MPKLLILWNDLRGGAAIEYGMIAGIIAISIAAAFSTMVGRLTNAFNGLNF